MFIPHYLSPPRKQNLKPFKPQTLQTRNPPLPDDGFVDNPVPATSEAVTKTRNAEPGTFQTFKLFKFFKPFKPFKPQKIELTTVDTIGHNRNNIFFNIIKFDFLKYR